MNIASEFQQRWKFPHCIGCIDGKHVRIIKPANSGSDFYNYKEYFSIVLLAICDSRYRIIYADVGAPGRGSDGGTFCRTKLFESIVQGHAGIPAPDALPSRALSIPYFFLGDEAFALSDFIMKPFPRSSTEIGKRIFNRRLAGTRRMIECVFGIMTAKFRVLKTEIAMDPEKATSIVWAITVLHNFIIHFDKNDYIPPNVDTSTGDNLDGLTATNSSSRMAPPGPRGAREEIVDYFLTNGAENYQWDILDN